MLTEKSPIVCTEDGLTTLLKVINIVWAPITEVDEVNLVSVIFLNPVKMNVGF